MNLLLNVLWVIFGGLWMAVGWLLAAVIMAITIIGIPWARAAFNIARYTFLPFGFARLDELAVGAKLGRFLKLRNGVHVHHSRQYIRALDASGLNQWRLDYDFTVADVQNADRRLIDRRKDMRAVCADNDL